MEQKQKEHIVKNLNKLAKCTKNEQAWYDLLLEYKFLISKTLKKVRNSPNTMHSRIRKIYIECLKTPEFELLIQTLIKSQNDDAANILEEFVSASLPTSSKSRNKSIWFGMQSLTKHYKGREEELQTIHDFWLESCIDDKLAFLTITGLGGIGKSELARKYANKFFTEIQGHCIWINAENEIAFTDSFHRLAKKIGVSLEDCRGKEKSRDSLFFGVLKFFSMKNYMIVFDNLETYEDDFFKCFLEHTSKLPPIQTKPFIILTSRCQLGKTKFEALMKQIQLSVLPTTSSVSYFKDALSVSDECELMLSDLCKELDHFPLAMQQAAAYINEMKRNSDVSTEIREYLKIFKTESKILLQHRVPIYQNQDSFSKPTYLTWQITLDKFKHNPKFYSKITLALNFISFFQSENITVTLLKSIIRLAATESTDKELAFYEGGPDIFETLIRYSMCEISRFENEVYLSVHRLVQTVTQIRLKEEQKWAETWNMLIQIVNDIFKDNVTSKEVHHIEYLLRYTEERTEIIQRPEIFYDLLEKVQKMYVDTGLNQKGKIFGEFAIEQVTQLFGYKARQTLRIMTNHANCLVQCGSPTKAEFLIDEVYFIQLKVNESPSVENTEKIDILQTKGIKAAILNQKGKYDEAVKMYLEILEVEHQVHEIEHPSSLAKQNNTEFEQGKSNYDQAIQIGLKVLEICKRLFGIDHPNTVNLKKSIEPLHNCILIYDEGLKWYLEIWKVGRHLQAIDHPSTIAIKKQLEWLHQRLRKLDEPLKKYLDVVKDMMRLIRIDQNRTLITKNEIAMAHQNKGNYDEALKMLLEILEAREHILGIDHPDVLDTKNSIAMTHQRKGNNDEALKWYLEAQEARERVLGIDYSCRLSMMYNIALSDQCKGNYEDAFKMLLKVQKFQEELLEIDHTDILYTKHNIALTLQSKKNYDDALKMFVEVLEASEEFLGIDHPVTLTIRHNIALTHQLKGDYDNALKMLLEVLKVEKNVLKIDNLTMLNTRNSIASTYDAKGSYDDALIMYLEVIDVSERVLGADHLTTLTAKNNLAKTHFKKQNYDVALKILLEVHRVWVRVLGSDHTNTLTILDNIGLMYFCMGKRKEALIIHLAWRQANLRVLGNSGS